MASQTQQPIDCTYIVINRQQNILFFSNMEIENLNINMLMRVPQERINNWTHIIFQTSVFIRLCFRQ